MSSGKFQYRKVLQLISAQERELDSMVNFLLKAGAWQQNSVQKIGEISKLMQGRSKLTSKELMRSLGDLSINRFENQRCDFNFQLIKDRLMPQLQQGQKVIKTLKDRAKLMEGKKDTLSAQQLEAFRKQLKDDLIGVSRRKQQVIKMYSHNALKLNCEYLEILTNSMQRQHDKQQQKKK